MIDPISGGTAAIILQTLGSLGSAGGTLAGFPPVKEWLSGCKTRLVKGRLLPGNHDLVRGIRTAHLCAIDVVARRHSDMIAAFPDRKIGSDEGAFANNLRSFIDQRLRVLTSRGIDHDVLTIEDIDHVLDHLVHPATTEGYAACAMIARNEAVARALAEIETDAGRVSPPMFRRIFDGEGGAGWYDAFALYVMEELKTNERFRSIFFAAELLDIKRITTMIELNIGKVVARFPDLLKFLSEARHRLSRLQDGVTALLGSTEEILAAVDKLNREFKMSPPNPRANGELSAKEITNFVDRLTLESFEAEGDLGREAVKYLRGGFPSPKIAVHVAVPRKIVETLIKVTQEFDALILHAPVGDGVSTILLQMAYNLASQGKHVFRVAMPQSFFYLDKILPVDQHAVVIFDDAHQITEMPSWLGRFDRKVIIVFGTQTGKRNRLPRFPSQIQYREVSVPKLRLEDAKQFTDQIIHFGAAPEHLSSNRIVDLFKNGLSQGKFMGGLWPAQYQATRGDSLDRRMKSKLDDLDDAGRRLISIFAFLNFLGYLSKDENFPTSRWSFVQAILEELGLEPEVLRQCLAAKGEIISSLEGEVRSAGSIAELLQTSNPLIEFRHPSVSDSLFRWTMGANSVDDAAPRGEFRFLKWKCFEAVLEALIRNADVSSRQLYSVIQSMMSGTHHDVQKPRELKKYLIDDKHLKVGDYVLAAIKKVEERLVFGDHESASILRLLLILKASIYVYKPRYDGQKRIPADARNQALDCLKAGCIDAYAERHDTVLRYAGSVLQRIDASIEIEAGKEGDWRFLIEEAERFEREKSAERPLAATREYLRLALNETNSFDVVWLLGIVDRSRLVESRSWDRERLDILYKLLKWMRREGKGKQVRYLIPRDQPPSTLASLAGIYRAVWRELARQLRENPGFQKMETFQSGITGPITGQIKNALVWWGRDYESDDDIWPLGVIKLVNETQENYLKWLPFIRRYHEFFRS